MEHDISPGVERAAAAAEGAAAGRGSPVRLADWLLALLDDDEGRPWELLVKLGADPRAVCAAAAAEPAEYLAPTSSGLYSAARKHSIRLRGEPSLTTDVILLAVLTTDERFARAVRLSVPAVEAGLRSPLMVAPGGADRPPSPGFAGEGLGVRVCGSGLPSGSPLRFGEGLGEGSSASPTWSAATPPPNPLPEAERGPAPSHSPEPKTLTPNPSPAKPGEGGQHSPAARIVDANLNRARESLRVLEDYVRFARNDARLSEQLKRLRHQLATLSAELPPSLLASRDTPGDVGTAVTAAGEYDRRSPRQVAEVNFKRLQESLRSVEEFGKLFGPNVGRMAEAMRYAAYTLERAVLLGGDLRERLAAARLYVLLDASGDPERVIAEAAAGGADVIQLREKGRTDKQLLTLSLDVRRWTRQAGVLFVMNDRPDLARLAEADGVHLGQDDLPVSAARRVVGPDTLIGVSTHTMEQLHQAGRDGADYIGVGPTFPSSTKPFADFPGPAFVSAAVQATDLPAFVLGGINADTVHVAVRAGATRLAVSAAVAKATDPRSAAALLRAALP